MSWLSFILILLGSSWAGVGLLRWYMIDKGMLDKPGERSSHTTPTPRGGGAVFASAWFILMGVLHYFGYVSENTLWLFIPAAIVALVGVWEDFKGVPALWRFVLQAVAAIILLVFLNEGGELVQMRIPYFLPLPLCFALAVLLIVWMVNLYNFMDGSDGLATTEAIFVFAVGGGFLYQQAVYEFAILAWGLSALLAGFLTWNWPVARMFMGDCGSYFLGLMITTFALLSHKYFNIPIEIWLILTTAFWFDATVTLLRRINAREAWRKPHRSHAYQRLIQAGWSHQQVLFGLILVNTLLSGLAIWASSDPRLLLPVLGLSVGLLAFIYIAIEIYKPMFGSWQGIQQNNN